MSQARRGREVAVPGLSFHASGHTFASIRKRDETCAGAGLNNDLLAEVGALPATVSKTFKHTLSGSIWRPLGIMAVLTRDTRNAKEPYPILVQSAKRLPMTPKVFFR